MRSHSPSERMKPIGADAAAGVGVGLSDYDLSSDVSTMASHLELILTYALKGIGLNAMAALEAGINTGRSGVITAMRAAAQAAVDAAKTVLKIASPSGVFRDEIGRMAMKGFGKGVLLESRAQARTIQNAARYLTSEAKAGAIAYNNDNRRTYSQHSSVAVNVDNLHVNDRQDLHGLALEISHLVKRQLAGTGVRV